MTSTARHYTPSNRDESDIYAIILHSTSGTGSANDLVRYFATTDRQASAHVIVDANGAVAWSVDAEDIAYHAGNWELNKKSLGIELVGRAGQATFPAAQLRSLIGLMARLSHKYDLSLKRIYDYSDGRIQIPFGVAQHANVWGNDHTDIAPGFPIRDICAHARDLRNKTYGVPRVERS